MELSHAPPQIRAELCNHCGLCVEACTCRSIAIREAGPVLRCVEQPTMQCPPDVDCGCLCEEVCPTGALQCAFEIVLEE